MEQRLKFAFLKMKGYRLKWSSLLLLSGLFSCGTPKVILEDQSVPDKNQIIVSTAVTDQLGNLYYAKYSNEIIKEDPTGKQIGYFSNNQLGQIGAIDATSPLKVLVFYPAFNTGVVLDRRLLETGRFSLIEMGFGEIDLVSFSRDGALWIFDDHEQRLFKVNQQGEILRKGDDLRLVFNERLQPSRLIEAGENLYLGVPGRGLLLFDLFGQYKSQMLYPELRDFQIINDESMVFEKEGTLMVVQMMNLQEQHFELRPEMQKGRMLLTKQQLIQITSDEIIRWPTADLMGN